MKRIAAAVLAAVIVLSIVGCGGDSEIDPMSLLVDSVSAMSAVGGYHLSGSIETWGSAATRSQPGKMDIEADVQNTGGEIKQHMLMTAKAGGEEDYVVEVYMVGGAYYQKLPGQEWMKESSDAYQTTSMNLGLFDSDQVALMAELASGAEVTEDDDQQTAISFHLDKAYFDASLRLYEEGQGVSEELLQMQEAIEDFQADVRIWIRKSDNLFERMEMAYTMKGMAEMDEIGSSVQVVYSDYGQVSAIELPPEAEQAQEYAPQ